MNSSLEAGTWKGSPSPYLIKLEEALNVMQKPTSRLLAIEAPDHTAGKIH
jgi:hypothetical protein